MKKLPALILLICHMNFSMFLPQMAEVDTYDSNGQQTDDINSVVEYVAIALGYDHTAEDEDDDSGENFHVVKAFDYFYQQQISIIPQREHTQSNKNSFAVFTVTKLASISYDIIAPPPEA